MLKIRLSRLGSKKDPHYPIVVIESTKSRDGEFCAKVGHYHPRVVDASQRVVVNVEMLKKWLSVGAQPTDTVRRLVKGLKVGLFEDFTPHMANKKFHGISKKKAKEILKQELASIAEAKKLASEKKVIAEKVAKEALDGENSATA